MRVDRPGHCYGMRVYDHDGKGSDHDPIRFMYRVGPKYPGNTGKPHPGTNLQEVLRVCINRTQYLDNQEHHWINTVGIGCLRLFIFLLEIRASERHKRILHPMFLQKQIEIYDACKKCGHLHTQEEGCGIK
jgi:hypothetical protein